MRILRRSPQLGPLLRNPSSGHQLSIKPPPRHASTKASSVPGIHILGVGSIGKFLAHGLATKPNPPTLSLIFHRANLIDSWKEEGQSVELISEHGTSRSSGYNIEVLSKPSVEAHSAQTDRTVFPDAQGLITNLIVATKTTRTIQALEGVRNRITPETTILFAQNGIGIIDEVNRLLFPNVASRPKYAAAIVRQAMYGRNAFTVVHPGKGFMTVGMVSPSAVYSTEGKASSSLDTKPPAAHELFLDAIAESPELNATKLSTVDLLMSQYEKLVINGVMSPLSVILNCKYGDVFESSDPERNSNARLLARRLIEEMSEVVLYTLKSHHAFQRAGNVDFSRFLPDNLETIIVNISKIVIDSYASMLQDVRAGRETEIDYINGHISKKSMESGIPSPINEMAIELVNKGLAISQQDAQKIFQICRS